jgi:hypothetical protein
VRRAPQAARIDSPALQCYNNPPLPRSAPEIPPMLKKALGLLGSLLIIAGLVLVALFGYTVRSQWPQITDTLDAPGLRSAVEVVRDTNGVPHIYADSTYDLFFAQATSTPKIASGKWNSGGASARGGSRKFSAPAP